MSDNPYSPYAEPAVQLAFSNVVQLFIHHLGKGCSREEALARAQNDIKFILDETRKSQKSP